MPKSILAWHFLAQDRRITNHKGSTYSGDRENSEFAGQLVTPGTKLALSSPEKIELWGRGLYGSRNLLDAVIMHAPSPFVERVRLSGHIIEGRGGKLVASERETLWIMDASLTLNICAVNFAQMMLDAKRATCKVDDRLQNVLDVKLRWLDGRASDSELDGANAKADDALKDMGYEVMYIDPAWRAARSAGGGTWGEVKRALECAAASVSSVTARDTQNQILETALLVQFYESVKPRFGSTRGMEVFSR